MHHQQEVTDTKRQERKKKKKGQGYKVVEGKDKRTKRKQRLWPRREERKLTGSE